MDCCMARAGGQSALFGDAGEVRFSLHSARFAPCAGGVPRAARSPVNAVALLSRRTSLPAAQSLGCIICQPTPLSLFATHVSATVAYTHSACVLHTAYPDSSLPRACRAPRYHQQCPKSARAAPPSSPCAPQRTPKPHVTLRASVVSPLHLILSPTTSSRSQVAKREA